MPDGPAAPESKLPDDLAVCHGMIREMLSTHRSQQTRIEHLEHQLDQLLRRLYGPRADRLHPDQGTLFGDPPPEPPPPQVDPPRESPHEPKAKTGHGRQTLPTNLRRETIVVDIPEAEKLAVGGTAEAAEVLTPLYGLLKSCILGSRVLHTDDTPIPVQDSEHCRTGRIWAYVSKSGIIYDATADRCRDGPLAFLQGFQGDLQCDAYAGYDELFKRSRGRVVEVACWAHARRKFVEAEKTSPAIAHEAVARIRALYAVEHEAKDLEAAARAALRQQKSKPLLDAMNEWLARERRLAIPKTPIAEAFTYLANQWEALTVYLRDGDLAIDNNIAERAVKPFAIGRKNWMFFGSDRGGRTLATLASFTATCELLKLNPWLWLRDTLTQLPSTPADQLAALLPVK